MVLLGVLVALVAAGCGQEPAAPAGGRRSATLLPEDRLALPEFDLAEFQALLDELRGTPVVVNIWGSWCPPCAAEAPELAEVAREFEGQVQFIGVDILDSRPAARQFILASDWPYPSVFDPKGAIRDGMGYLGQPVTVVYDAEGRKAFEWTGAVTAQLLRKEIRKVL
jgi:thiol-disulfide isomerase/thioredoxin